MNKGHQLRKSRETDERSEAAANRIVRKETRIEYLTAVEAISTLRLVSKLGATTVDVLPTHSGLFLVIPQYNAAIYAKDAVTSEFISELEILTIANYPYASRDKLIKSISSELLEDLAQPTTAVSFLTVLALVAAAFAPFGVPHAGDPTVQLIAPMVITIASVYLAVFALFSGLARQQIAKAPNEYLGHYQQYRQDRLILTWVLASIVLSAASLAIFCIPTYANPYLTVWTSWLCHSALALGAASIVPPIVDILPFFLSRSIGLSATNTVMQLIKSNDTPK